MLKKVPNNNALTDFLASKREQVFLKVERNDLDIVSDYRALANIFDWTSLFRANGEGNLQLLDIGCGTGRWLDALLTYNPGVQTLQDQIRYSAVDPSAEALNSISKRAMKFFSLEDLWEAKIEDRFGLPEAHFDLIWSVHSFYALPISEISFALEKIISALRPDGTVIIVLAEEESFYGNAKPNLVGGDRFTCASDIKRCLNELGRNFEFEDFSFIERYHKDDFKSLQKFVFDESINNSYPEGEEYEDQRLEATLKGEWLQKFLKGDFYEFPQKTSVIAFNGYDTQNSSLVPSRSEMKRMSRIANKFVIDEHQSLPHAKAHFFTESPPRWIHTEDIKLDLQMGEKFTGILEDPLPEAGTLDFEKLIHEELAKLSRFGTLDNAPGYMGYIPSGGLFHGALAEWLAASMNRYVTTFHASPGLAAIESVVISWLLEMIGIQQEAASVELSPGGILLSGGSSAAVHAVHAARALALAKALPSQFVAYIGENAHSSIRQAIEICGIANFRVVPVDMACRIRTDSLRSCIEEDLRAGLCPFLVVATAGDVSVGAIDEFCEISEICVRYDVWMHVDASYGGLFSITDRGRQALVGLVKANSVSVDPHKTLGLPYGLGALLVRDKETLSSAFSFSGNYLRPSGGAASLTTDIMDMGLEYTREFRGLRLWLSLKTIGLSPFRENLDEKLDFAELFAEALMQIPHVELVSPTSLSICVFRLKAPFSDTENRRLLDEINRGGEFFLTGCTPPEPLGGGFAIRAVLLSFRADAVTLQKLVERVSSSVSLIASER